MVHGWGVEVVVVSCLVVDWLAADAAWFVVGARSCDPLVTKLVVLVCVDSPLRLPAHDVTSQLHWKHD